MQLVQVYARFCCVDVSRIICRYEYLSYLKNALIYWTKTVSIFSMLFVAKVVRLVYPWGFIFYANGVPCFSTSSFVRDISDTPKMLLAFIQWHDRKLTFPLMTGSKSKLHYFVPLTKKKKKKTWGSCFWVTHASKRCLHLISGKFSFWGKPNIIP